MDIKIRERAILNVQRAFERAKASIDTEGVFRTLFSVFQMLVGLSYEEREGVKPFETRPIVNFAKRLAIRAGGKMDTEGEDPHSLFRDLDWLYYSGDLDIDKPIEELDSIAIISAITDVWEIVKNNADAYRILMYTMRYSACNEVIVTESDKEMLESIINQLSLSAFR